MFAALIGVIAEPIHRTTIRLEAERLEFEHRWASLRRVKTWSVEKLADLKLRLDGSV